jgi:hypothetical protein
MGSIMPATTRITGAPEAGFGAGALVVASSAEAAFPSGTRRRPTKHRLAANIRRKTGRFMAMVF